MKKTLIATLVAASALTVAGVASAANTSGFAGAGNGFYVGGDVGYGYGQWNSKSDASYDGAYTFNSKGGFAWGLQTGYMFNSNVGLELAYDALDSTKIMNGSTQVGKIKSQSGFGMLAVLNLPINNNFATFAKLGGTDVMAKADYTNGRTDEKYNLWAPTAAVGAAYMFTPSLGLNAQVKYIAAQSVSKASGQATTNVSPNIWLATTGVTYKF